MDLNEHPDTSEAPTGTQEDLYPGQRNTAVTERIGPRLKATWSSIKSETRWAFVIAISIVTISVGFFGWHLRPNDSPPSVPRYSDLLFQLFLFRHVSGATATLVMSTSGSAVEIGIDAQGTVPSNDKPGLPWELDVSNSTNPPYVCNGTNIQRQPGGVFRGYDANPNSDVLIVNLGLCWITRGPIVNEGSYLTAVVPRLELADSGSVSSSVQMSQQIEDPRINLYNIQVGQPPDSITAGRWIWKLSGHNGDTMNENIVTAANIVGLSRDNQNVFISGVLLGIAGAGLLAVLQELTLSAYRRRTAGPSAADG